VRLTVQAGGGPYGRVSWEAAEYVSSRPPQTAVMTTLYLTRTGGSQGRLRIYYQYVVKCCPLPFAHAAVVMDIVCIYVKKLISLKHCVRSQITRLKLQKSFCDLEHGAPL